MVKLFRLLVPANQTSLCKTCGLTITERRRKPCRRCGGLTRNISVYAVEDFGSVDRVE